MYAVVPIHHTGFNRNCQYHNVQRSINENKNDNRGQTVQQTTGNNCVVYLYSRDGQLAVRVHRFKNEKIKITIER